MRLRLVRLMDKRWNPLQGFFKSTGELTMMQFLPFIPRK